MSGVLQWLDTHGVDRQRAVEQATDMLTEGYRRKYGKMIPPELHRLAALVSAKISYVNNLPGGARLVPVAGGFDILVDSSLNAFRTRTAIAHELAHTLFYSSQEPIPKRLSPPSKNEEHFCFDVARRILAPEWMIRSVGISNLRDTSEMFLVTSKTFKLSRQMASRVLLQDYCFLSGVAAVWTKHEQGWKMKPGNCYASPDLSRKERMRLHGVARAWLGRERSYHDTPTTGIVGSLGSDGRTAFVLIARGAAARAL